MHFITKHHAPQTLANPFFQPMSANKDSSLKKTAKTKTDHATIKREKVGEMRAVAQPVENYQPLFKKIHEQVGLEERY